ncbi:efflux RND transporter permease subunit, partial [Staphylococcus epidermidis]|uniref:efflux RND transporter permease subunit n=1 Tax=Staphylococcus epidermidis TaxID=1282 RepID=UPI0011A758E1
LNPQKTKDVLTTVEKDGNSLDVIVQQEQADQPDTVDELLDKKIPTALGDTVPLSDLGKVKKRSTYKTLDGTEGQYYATVAAK